MGSQASWSSTRERALHHRAALAQARGRSTPGALGESSRSDSANGCQTAAVGRACDSAAGQRGRLAQPTTADTRSTRRREWRRCRSAAAAHCATSQCWRWQRRQSVSEVPLPVRLRENKDHEGNCAGASSRPPAPNPTALCERYPLVVGRSRSSAERRPTRSASQRCVQRVLSTRWLRMQRAP